MLRRDEWRVHDMSSGNFNNREKIETLCSMVKRKRNILILTHNNPDPDSLASALALKYFLKQACRVDSLIAFGGVVGRAENKAMLRYLKIDARPFSEISIKRFSVVALVDTQPGAGNNSLPKSIVPSIVIDHHRPIRAATRKVPYVDIRTGYGSTSTILTEYLRDAGIEGLDRTVATALLYGIKSDTRDLGRGTGPRDMDAYLFLYPWVRFRVLSKIENPQLSRVHFKLFEQTIHNAMVYGDVVMSDVGHINNADILAEMADLLIRLEGMRWALSVGEYGGDIYFSVRAKRAGVQADRIVRRMVEKIGSAGGHDMVAAGKITKALVPDKDYAAIVKTLVTRFLKGVKRDDAQGRPLS
jgi:nanoRNase/pAp phosphatase (c-di-AMP/oligoRNAs hydrolase)